MTPAGRSPDPSANEPFLPDLSEGAETGVYLALLELIDEGLIITGDEIVFDANSAACRLLEREYRELAGQPLSRLFPDEAAFLHAREALLIRGERRSLQRLALPDGSCRELQVICAPRLRPGVHALILSPVSGAPDAMPFIQASAAEADPTAGDTSAPTTPFASHLDAAQRRTRRYGQAKRTPRAPRPATQASASVTAGLRNALQHDGLQLHFQPLIDVRNGEVHGAEALLRWRHPQLGLLPFGRFKAAIADASLLSGLGDWALWKACAAARAWPQARSGRTPARLTVNVAAEQLAAEDFAARVRAALESGGLSPENLELDLDEGVLVADRGWLGPKLQALAELGVRLAIDDYGRGLSSIPQLRRYPLRAIKLDPALVAGVGRSEESEAIVEAIANMATVLGLEVFARGVEDAAQQAFLRALGCHLQQGPLYGLPMTADEFARYLAGPSAQ